MSLLKYCAGMGVVAAVITGCSVTENSGETPVTQIGADVPKTAQAFRNKPENFQFAIVGDRTGGHRPGVFAQAMQQINWIQPEFVISVGDHIEGYTEDRNEIDRQWDEVEALVNSLEMPYFHVVGNHDISNLVMRDRWRERLGRDYYHFVYKNVLFLSLSTEDPPGATKKDLLSGFDPQQLEEAIQALGSGEAVARKVFAEKPELAKIAQILKNSDKVTISDEQVAYFNQALRNNPDVRWAIVLMHKPAWRYESKGFSAIQKALAESGRPFTMFAGHMHYYSNYNIDGREYIQLGTTGGTQTTHPEGPGTLDHIMWVTMTDEGPEIANIRLDGIYDRYGPQGKAIQP